MYIHPVFHLPHDGGEFPPELMRSVCVPREQFLRYHEKMRDRDVLQVVPYRWRDGDHLVFFPVSRLLCDVERFIGPQEVMERYGMGYCYERSYDGRHIKRVDDELLARTRALYDRHHRLLDGLCQRHERILLIDVHSFSDDIVPAAFLTTGRDLPDVCIGADPAFSDPEPISIAEEVLRQAGFSTAVNYPYSGCMVPNCVLSGAFNGRFSGLMLEFNKRVYCDPQERSSPDRLKLLRDLVGQIVLEINTGKMQNKGPA